MENKLWCDLKTDEEKIKFIESGRAWETGIMSKEIQKDIIDLLNFRIKLKNAEKSKLIFKNKWRFFRTKYEIR